MSEGHTERLEAALDGKYRIERKLGEGGMASVYLAEDVKHKRKVALKILRPELAAVLGAERFLAEIQTTANLQHPHILALFDSGEAEGYLYYVMPYIDGETLREKLDREKQLGVEEAVRIAREVADALDYAHRAGVIHRDIKPGNILLHDGRPVVADFGIALAVSAAGGGRMTETGLSLGTPHYMSPEQASADRDLSARSDVYSLGCVLYEMIAGQPPHTGPSAQAILVRIMTKDATPLSELRRTVPPHVAATVAKSIEKLPADRFETARQFREALEDQGFSYQAEPSSGTTESAAAAKLTPAGAAGVQNRAAMVFGSLFAVTAIALGWSVLRPDPALPVMRLAVEFSENQEITGQGAFDISSDGSFLVYQGPSPTGEGTQLWARRWAALDATPIPGTENVTYPAISPNGQEVAFQARRSIRVVPIQSGNARTVASDAARCCVRWSPDGAWLYFNTPAQGLSRVPATGGPIEAVTQPDTVAGDAQHIWIDVLPGGDGAVFEGTGGPAGPRVMAVDIVSGDVKELTPGLFPRYSQGYLLFTDGVGGTLFAQAFDAARMELRGTATPIAEGLRTPRSGWNYYAASQTGHLFYSTGEPVEADTELVWVARDGAEAQVGWNFMRGGTAYSWRLSPGGTHVALRAVTAENSDIWVKELPDRPPRRLTTGQENDNSPWWTPDGLMVSYIAFAEQQVRSVQADGSGEPTLLFDGGRAFRYGEWSSDNEWLVLSTEAGRSSPSLDIVAVRPTLDNEATPLVATSDFAETDPALSPDGRWLAYASNETGEYQVWVRSFPDVEASPIQVSVSGGSRPRWAHDRPELYYLGEDREFVAARFVTTSGFDIVEQDTLFVVPAGLLLGGATAPFDVSPDGDRFLMARNLAAEAISSADILVTNWVEELQGRLGN